MNQVIDGEEWKEIEGFDGLYQISNLGKIKSFWNGKEKYLNPSNHYTSKKNHYYRSVINLTNKEGKRKMYKVHQLVAKAFIPNPNNYLIINHIDGNPLNNRVDNLEWCTQKHNIDESIKNEQKVYRINTIDRDTMVDLLNSGKSYEEIANILGIATGTVFNYIRRFNIIKKNI